MTTVKWCKIHESTYGLAVFGVNVMCSVALLSDQDERCVLRRATVTVAEDAMPELFLMSVSHRGGPCSHCGENVAVGGEIGKLSWCCNDHPVLWGTGFKDGPGVWVCKNCVIRLARKEGGMMSAPELFRIVDRPGVDSTEMWDTLLEDGAMELVEPVVIDIVLKHVNIDNPDHIFVEIESPPGTSIKLGKWIELNESFMAIRFTAVIEETPDG